MYIDTDLSTGKLLVKFKSIHFSLLYSFSSYLYFILSSSFILNCVTKKWTLVHFLPLGEPSSREHGSFSVLAKSMPAEHPSECGGEILPLHPLYNRKEKLFYYIKKEDASTSSFNVFIASFMTLLFTSYS